MTESPLERLRRLEGGRAVPGSAAAPGPGGRRRAGIGAAALAALLLLLTKGKVVLLLLVTKGKLLLGALKLGPMLTTLSTMGLSIWAYSSFYGWKLAAGVVLLILVHELGHGAAARLMGLRVGAPVFIPFFGALIMMKEQPRTAWVESVVGFGGPAAGLLGGVVALAWALWAASGDLQGLLIVIAWITFLMNFFNLMPVFGLDGDRISQPFRPWFWLPGCAFLGYLAWTQTEGLGQVQPFLVFMIVLGGFKGLRLWWRGRSGSGSLLERLRERGRYREPQALAAWQPWAAAACFFGLAALLNLLLIYADGLRPVMS